MVPELSGEVLVEISVGEGNRQVSMLIQLRRAIPRGVLLCNFLVRLGIRVGGCSERLNYGMRCAGTSLE